MQQNMIYICSISVDLLAEAFKQNAIQFRFHQKHNHLLIAVYFIWLHFERNEKKTTFELTAILSPENAILGNMNWSHCANSDT